MLTERSGARHHCQWTSKGLPQAALRRGEKGLIRVVKPQFQESKAVKRNTLKKFLPQRPKGVTKGPPVLKGELPSHQLISGTA